MKPHIEETLSSDQHCLYQNCTINGPWFLVLWLGCTCLAYEVKKIFIPLKFSIVMCILCQGEYWKDIY